VRVSTDSVEAVLQVEGDDGAPRALSVDDLKTPATGAASEGTLSDVRDRLPASEAGRLPVRSLDATPPLTGAGKIGDDIAPGQDTIVAGAGGIKVALGHDGTTGRMWLGFGEAAEEGRGIVLDPGGSFEEFTGDEVHVLLIGADAPQRIVGQRWAA
jgi:hypothetical protein